MANISKSRYTTFLKSPRELWLSIYRKDLAIVNPSAQQRFDAGHLLGDYAKKIIAGTVDVTCFNEEGKLDISKMIESTSIAIQNNVPAIAEASFSFGNMFASIDILKNNNDGTWDIYEVKSSSEVKDIYLYDIAFQKHLLIKCGLKIENSFVVYVNKDYKKHGKIEIDKLFTFFKTDDLITSHMAEIDENVAKAIEVLSLKEEPQIDIDENINKPYKSPFWEYYTSHLPKPNVFDIYRLSMKKKIYYYKNNIISFEDLKNTYHTFNEIQQRQIDWSFKGDEYYIDKPNVKKFLKNFTYPLYFLDFETIEGVIPMFDGTSPNQKIIFQYSLHLLNAPDAPLEHYEFLAEHQTDPRREVAEKLIKQIKDDGGSIVVYNKAFEVSRIKELAKTFPDLEKSLLKINKRVLDLLDVFTGGYVYHKNMGGSFSIKSTLPALFPNDAGLNYKNLNDVHNGTDAQLTYLGLSMKTEDERMKLRQSLLSYCELDTYAMVMIYMWLLKNTII
ncbi:MAG: DUF2779 domain-containing protein [Clostridia bacterium]|nr:DUF2779 domain-containing protein [Clostridia bacterium]